MREACVLEENVEIAQVQDVSLVGPLSSDERSHNVRISKIIAERTRAKNFFWSVELVPGTTPLLQTLLDQSLQQLLNRKPAFASVTWHTDHLKLTNSGDLKVLQHPALDLGKLLQEVYGIPVLLHLAAGKMKRKQVQLVLQACLHAGITNILALRGDDSASDFKHASDLVLYIRKVFSSKFDIGVAGYPSVHPDSTSQAEDLYYLREKVSAGADFILTQLVTSFEEFNSFIQSCEEVGIRVPIIPGVYLIQSYSAFHQFTKTCNIKVPEKHFKKLKSLKDKEEEKNMAFSSYRT